MKKLSFFKDLELLVAKSRGEQVLISDILSDLNYRSHGLIILLLSVPFVVPMPIMGLSTLFGGVMMISAVSIMSGLSPWIPKRWRNRSVPRETLVRLMNRSEKMAVRLERYVRPRMLSFSKSPFWVRIHGLMILIAAIILALPSPPGGNVLPGAATFILAIGLVEEDGLFLALGYLLTFVNIVLVTLIVVYGLDWLMSFFS